jgi:hypothetical protein
LKETADKVRYHPQGLERWQIENLGMVIGNGYRYENAHSITTTGYEFTDPTIDRQMGYGRVNMLSAIMNAAALQTGGFTINGSWTHNEVIVNNINDHSYLYSLTVPFNEKYDYDAILNQDGANLIFEGNGSTLTINDGATFRVDAGATLTMKSGSLLNVKNDARIIIDTGGKLVFEDGASIYLESDNSILEIRGDLELGTNAVFTFTGDGFIRFNLPQTWGFPNVLATSTSSVVLEGSSKSDKIVEIVAGSWLSPTDNFADFTIKNGTVMMGEDAFINIGSTRVELNNIKVTKLNSVLGYVHSGIFINGQQNHTINNIEIEHGKVGLTARNFYSDGADVFIRNSHFHNNDIGLRTNGKGARLESVIMHDNETGWEAIAMDRPTQNKFGYVHDNLRGISYDGSGSGSLYLNECAVVRNLTNGIQFSGKSLLSAKCGSVSDNLEAGFCLGIGSFLNLSNSGIPNLKAGSVNASNNLYNMQFLPYSFVPFLELGNNNFAIDLSQGPPNSLIANGYLLWDCYNNVPNKIYALNNQWYHNSPTTQPDPSDYNLYTYNCIPNKNLHLDDPAPNKKINCPLTPVSPSDPEVMREGSPLAYCEECPQVQSDYFHDTTDFREAVIIALNITSYADSINGDDANAVELFCEIIRKASEYYDHEEVQWLANYSYYFLQQSFGSGISRGTIAASVNDPHFEKLSELQNFLIELAINYDEPIKQFMYRMDQALLYNLADDRLTALALLEESAACIELDEELQAWVNHWKAHINTVEIINNGEAHVMDYDNLYLEGYNSGGRLYAGLGVAKRDTVIQSSTAFSITGSQTANDNSGNQYFISSVVKDSLTDFLIVKYDASTNILWSDTIGGWSKGADTARIVVVDDWDNVYMSGQAWNGSNYDVMTVKYDSTGAKQWIAMHNSSEKWHDVPYGITVDTSGFVYVALKSKSDSGSYHSMITYSQCNCPTGARLANPTLPESYTPTNYLESNLEVYPNPANKQLTITFTDRENEISVKMINALGQEIYKNNFNGVLAIDVSAFPKGVYLIHLEEKSGGTKTVKKVLLQ